MAKPSKAQIKYEVDGVESVFRFHSVIAEEHEVSTEITKFPIQDGFNVSNHTIKKNRIVTLTGVITNNLVVGAEEFYEYGGNNVRLTFDAMKNLVRSSVLCEVTTNFGDYSPVIFNRFKTKLVAGKTDVMEFTIKGEEVQLATTLNGNKPTLLTFTPVTGQKREARIDSLTKAGVDVPDGALLTEANVDLNQDFQIETKDKAGTTSITTYKKNSFDPTELTNSFKVHTDATALIVPEGSSEMNWYEVLQEEAKFLALPDVDLENGLSTASACLKDELVRVGTEVATDTIKTAIGDLKKSIYGAVYDTTGVNGDRSTGQVLLSIGIDCVVAGATGAVNPDVSAEDFQLHGLPTVDEILEGAATLGNALGSDILGVAAPTTLTKITPIYEDVVIFGEGQ